MLVCDPTSIHQLVSHPVCLYGNIIMPFGHLACTKDYVIHVNVTEPFCSLAKQQWQMYKMRYGPV